MAFNHGLLWFLFTFCLNFAYRDYSFIIVDPWPENWGNGGYESDDVYVDYDDGYYLYNRNHPGVAIAVTVVL